VKSRPNGKLSLWLENHPEQFIAVPTFAKSLFASVVKSDGDTAVVNRTYALYKSTIMCMNEITSFQALMDHLWLTPRCAIG